MTQFYVSSLSDRIKQLKENDVAATAKIKELLKKEFSEVQVKMQPARVLILDCPTKLQKIALMKAMPSYLSHIHMLCDQIIFKQGKEISPLWDTADMRKIVERLG